MGRTTTQGARLRAWRRERKYSQKDLAERLGIRQGSLAAYETDARVPRLDIAARIERETKGEIRMQGWAA